MTGFDDCNLKIPLFLAILIFMLSLVEHEKSLLNLEAIFEM